MKSMTILAALAAASIMTVASAQQGQMQGQSGFNLPDGCRSAAQASGQGNMMQKMDGGMSQQMQDIMAQMTKTQKDLHQVMMDMHGPMMMGMLAKDADVAWICSMIPHHQGAIAMARAGLQGADNAEIEGTGPGNDPEQPEGTGETNRLGREKRPEREQGRERLEVAMVVSAEHA